MKFLATLLVKLGFHGTSFPRSILVRVGEDVKKMLRGCYEETAVVKSRL